MKIIFFSIWENERQPNALKPDTIITYYFWRSGAATTLPPSYYRFLWLEPILCSSSSYWIIFYTWIYRFIVSVFRYANLSFIDATCTGCVGRLDGGSWWFEIFQHSIWFSCDVRRSLLRSGLWKFVPAAWRSIRSLHVLINGCHRLFIRMARRLLHQT